MKSLIALFCGASLTAVAAPGISFERVPNGGIQPQVVTDEGGNVHLLYFAGAARAGNLFYLGPKSGGKPLRVNSREDSAIAIGTMRGGQLALGKNGRVHVAWNGAHALPDSRHEGAPMYYTRLNDAGTAFEAQRDLIHETGELDGGGAVAADASGNVYVVWHGHRPGDKKGEIGRAVYVAVSRDDGTTFAPEVRANPEPTGACGCCGLRAFTDRAGALYVLYRTAEDMVNRDAVLLVSTDKGRSFRKALSDRWTTGTCPASTAAFAEGADRVFAAWETAGQIRFSPVLGASAAERFQPPGKGKRRHPSMAVNKNGEVLLVWADGTGWERGGAIGWQLLDQSGKPIGEPGRKEGLPVWSFAAAYARPYGEFVILY